MNALLLTVLLLTAEDRALIAQINETSKQTEAQAVEINRLIRAGKLPIDGDVLKMLRQFTQKTERLQVGMTPHLARFPGGACAGTRANGERGEA